LKRPGKVGGKNWACSEEGGRRGEGESGKENSLASKSRNRRNDREKGRRNQDLTHTTTKPATYGLEGRRRGGDEWSLKRHKT